MLFSKMILRVLEVTAKKSQYNENFIILSGISPKVSNIIM